jgi:hypothetical protein
MLRAFREELADAGEDSIAEISLFHLHLDADERQAFITRLTLLLDDYSRSDPRRNKRGAPGYGGIVALHRLAGLSADDTA